MIEVDGSQKATNYHSQKYIWNAININYCLMSSQAYVRTKNNKEKNTKR